MNKIKYILLIVLSAFLFVNCSGGAGEGIEDTASSDILLVNSQIKFSEAAGTLDVSFTCEQDWTITCDEKWVGVNPSSGKGSKSVQSVSVTVSANLTAERKAKITISNSSRSVSINLTQSGLDFLSIEEFKDKKANTTDWYPISGEIVAIAGEEYGNFYISDGEELLYVYGLCEAKVDKNDKSFSNLGLQVGDYVYMMSLRSQHYDIIEAGGTIPAYYIAHEDGEYKYGEKSAASPYNWLELPATSESDGYDVLTHYFEDDKGRNYSLYWDYENLIAKWVAYPLCSSNIGTGDRTDAWALDPLLPADKQPVISGTYSTGSGKMYDRGHQIPSADRYYLRTNIQTFYGTNIAPQSTDLNGGVWANLEKTVRNIAKSSATDTLYVVTGPYIGESQEYVLDRAGKRVTVPEGYFKVLLRSLKDKSAGVSGYDAVAIYYENKKVSSSDKKIMSVDEIEEMLGIDFFVNLPDDIEKTLEASKETDMVL